MTEMLKRPARKRIELVATFALVVVTCYGPLWGSLPNNDTIRRRASKAISQDKLLASNTGSVMEPLKESDTPVYWHIPKSSGTSMKRYYGCMGLTAASETGIIDGHDKDETIQVWQRENEKFNKKISGPKLVNVDASTTKGIDRAKKLGLVQSGLADVVFANLNHYELTMFDSNHRARFFALFRHPIERAVSLFYYLQVAEWEKNANMYQPELASMTIEEWLFRQRRDKGDIMNILMKRFLNKTQFTSKDLEKAKDIVQTKYLVGLTSKMEESVDRFDTYFGWVDNEKRPLCQEEAIKSGFNKNPHPPVEKGSKTWNILADYLSYDLQLYDYIVQLYEEQGELFGATTVG
mmetsp:Transcript_15528/g.22705  ORF Transcript_15528/g.22705 Transcript_15528/m.22705 type:complete len:350 (-) Transcript_15528:208-1257(-)